MGHPFEAGFEKRLTPLSSKRSRARVCYASVEIFREERLFEGPSGVQENIRSVFVSPNLAARVHCSNIGAQTNPPRTIRLENIAVKTG
jgi:hypothetical protein